MTLIGNWFKSESPQIEITFENFDSKTKAQVGKTVYPLNIVSSFDEDKQKELEKIKKAKEHFLYKSNLVKGFFSYRELLATHFDSRGHDEVDISELLLEVILRNQLIYTNETLLESWLSLVKLYGDIQSDNQSKSELGEKLFNNFESFQNQFESLLSDLESASNLLNAKFKQGIEINLLLERVEPSSDFATPIKLPRVLLKVKYNGVEIQNHHLSLNEARLSALAISMYLGSMLNHSTEPDAYRILFLDDIFLGLDTSNRLPLLEILKDNFKDYQVFITTYDREWYEVASNYLGPKDWKRIELYSNKKTIVEHLDGNRYLKGSVEHPLNSREIDFEKPLILDSNLDYFSKAKIYFEKKDYPACANYQRKWCEQFLKAYLQENYLREIGVNDSVSVITKLETLFQKLKAFYKACDLDLPQIIETVFPSHRETVMNPFSHDNLSSPIYRRELEQGFELIEAFKQLKRLRKGVVAYKDDILEYHEPSVNYSCRFKITSQPLILVNHGGDLKILGKGDVIDFIVDGEPQNAPPKGMKDLTVDEFYEKINKHYLPKKYPGFSPNPDKFSALVLQPQRITLRDVIIG